MIQKWYFVTIDKTELLCYNMTTKGDRPHQAVSFALYERKDKNK